MTTPDVDAWNAWQPDELASRLAKLRVRWAVAAGWAIDLWLGGEPREHEDLEIAVARENFSKVSAALPEPEWFVPGGLDGVEEQLWPIDRAPDELHQTWGWDASNGCWRLDVFREPWEGDTWVCRRDPSVRRPVATAIERTDDGIPYLAPELVLLFKAKHAARPRDRLDFGRAQVQLGSERRLWLMDALSAVHPGHEWIALLAG